MGEIGRVQDEGESVKPYVFVQGARQRYVEGSSTIPARVSGGSRDLHTGGR